MVVESDRVFFVDYILKLRVYQPFTCTLAQRVFFVPNMTVKLKTGFFLWVDEHTLNRVKGVLDNRDSKRVYMVPSHRRCCCLIFASSFSFYVDFFVFLFFEVDILK